MDGLKPVLEARQANVGGIPIRSGELDRGQIRNIELEIVEIPPGPGGVRPEAPAFGEVHTRMTFDMSARTILFTNGRRL